MRGTGIVVSALALLLFASVASAHPREEHHDAGKKHAGEAADGVAGSEDCGGPAAGAQGLGRHAFAGDHVRRDGEAAGHCHAGDIDAGDDEGSPQDEDDDVEDDEESEDEDEVCKLEVLEEAGKACERAFSCVEKCLKAEERGKADGSCDLTDMAGMDSGLLACILEAQRKLRHVQASDECAGVEGLGDLLTEVIVRGGLEVQDEVDTISDGVADPRCQRRVVKEAGKLCKEGFRCLGRCLHHELDQHPDGPCDVLDPSLDSKTAECVDRATRRFARVAHKGSCKKESDLEVVLDAVVEEGRGLLQGEVNTICEALPASPAGAFLDSAGSLLE